MRPRTRARRTVTVVAAAVALALAGTAAVLALRGDLPGTGSATLTTSPDPYQRQEFPTRDSVGVPAGWEPREEISGDHTIWEDGAVLEDVRIVSGTLLVRGADVTLRRVELVDSAVRVLWDRCYNGLTIEDSSFLGTSLPQDSPAVVWPGGYSARNVLVDGPPEGLRAGGASRGCGPVTIEHSYVRTVHPPRCEGLDWHGDALQGQDSAPLTVRDSVLELVGDFAAGCGGNSPFFYPDQDNTSVTVDGLVVMGGGFSFRLETPGTVERLYVVDGSWEYGASVVVCDRVTAWDAHLATLDEAGQPVPTAALPCA